MASSTGTSNNSPSTPGRLRIRDGDEKATISRIWEALCLPEGERRYAWNVLKEDIAAQKAYGCRLRVVLGLKKEYVDLTHQRQAAIRSFLMLLNENHTKASLSTRRHIAKLVLNIRSLTSKVTFTLEKARAQCRLPLNLPSFSTEAINQHSTESWYARLLTENIFTEKVVIKLMLLVGFFDDPDRGEFVDVDTVSEAVTAFYKKSVAYGVWINPDTSDYASKERKPDQTGTFTHADVSLFLLLGLPILTLQAMDFTSLPEMLSQFLEAASEVPDMPLQSDEIKRLLVREGQRITEFRSIADEYLQQEKDIVMIPVQHRKETDQYEVYSTHVAPSQRSGSSSLFTRYHTPTDGSAMPKNVKPLVSKALPKKSKALTDGGIHIILKKIRGELSAPLRPLSNLDRASTHDAYGDGGSEAVHNFKQYVHSSGLYDTPEAPSMEEDMPGCSAALRSTPPNLSEDEHQRSSTGEDDLFSMPSIISLGEHENRDDDTLSSKKPTEVIDPAIPQLKSSTDHFVEQSDTTHRLVIYKAKFASPRTVNGSSYDLAIVLP